MKATRFIKIKVAAAVLVILAGLVVFGYPFFTDMQYNSYQAHVKQEIKETAKKVGQKEAPNTGGARNVFPGDVAAKITIPKIGLETYVLYGSTPEVLKNGPGLYEETPLPGTRGNAAIGGHRTTYGHPFLRLDELNVGDKIIAQTEDGQATFEVEEKKRVLPTDLSILDQEGGPRLTLTTCDPIGSAVKRLVVVGRLVSG